MVYCSTCHKILTDKKEIPATGHTEVADKAVEPTCTEDGKTEGKHCSVCGKILEFQKVIPATGHDWKEGEILRDPTCTEEGEKGYTCTKCQGTKTEKIPALGHTEVIDEAIAPTCEEAGKTAGIRCSVCNEIIKAQEEVPATGHKEVIDEAVDPTCEKTGKTEGSHCKTCEKVLKAQKEIPALGHKEAEIITKEATCEETGNILVYCSTCEKVLNYHKKIPATGHRKVADAEIAPTVNPWDGQAEATVLYARKSWNHEREFHVLLIQK